MLEYFDLLYVRVDAVFFGNALADVTCRNIMGSCSMILYLQFSHNMVRSFGRHMTPRVCNFRTSRTQYPCVPGLHRIQSLRNVTAANCVTEARPVLRSTLLHLHGLTVPCPFKTCS